MKRNKVKVSCAICNNDIETIPSRVKKTKNFACSTKCLALLRSKPKVMKLCKVCNTKMEIHPSMANRYSTCSKKCQRLNRSNEKNANWSHGKARTYRDLRLNLMSRLEYKNWRKAVYTRDDYTCQMCGKRGGHLEADHIKPWAFFPDLRYDINNGRTLCRPCHVTTFKDIAKYKKALGR
jgi:5-methylcytosine-specific restriction endonuclease McrA